MIWNRRRADALLKDAQAALRDKRWQESERLWRDYAALAPRDVRALTGLASTLIGLERWTDAKDAGESLSQRFPRHVEGPSVLARVAGQQLRWSDAESYWRDALARNAQDRNALAGRARALIRLGRLVEAEAALETLRQAWPTLPFHHIIATELAEARGDFEAAVAHSREAVTLFPDNRQALRDLGSNLLKAGRIAEADQVARQLLVADPYAGDILTGQILAQREPDTDHTDFWIAAGARHPASTEILRRRLHAALGAGRETDALAALDALIDCHHPRLSDASYVIGVINLLRGRQPETRRVLRAYLGRLRGRPEYHLALLRLSRQLLMDFRAAPSRLYFERSRDLLGRCGLTEPPRVLLERVLTVEEKLSRPPRIALLNTDVSIGECRTFMATVRERLARKEPFSFVRLGDGEANCLPYETALRPHAPSDAAEREVVWWGAPLSTDKRAGLAVKVLAAVRAADCVGVPTMARFLRDVALERDDALTASRSGRGLLAVLNAAGSGYLEDQTTPTGRVYVSAHLHQDLARWQLYSELFDGVGEIVCVSCHPDLPDALQAQFGVRTSVSHLIAPRSATARLMRKRIDDARMLPDMVDDVLTRMGDSPRGRLVVVGAGFLGKWIANEARARGGVALDLGSMVDYWIGLKTRSYLDLV